MPPVPAASKFTEENHTMLVQLKDSVGTIGSTLSQFIEAQGEENRRIHARIDGQGEAMTKAVGVIKDTISDRSRITPALVAMVLSSVAILGGAFTAYIGLQTAPIKTDILNVNNMVQTMEAQRLITRQDLVGLQIHTAEEEARLRENQRWTEKLLDEVRHK